jgi:hypothetical protein
MIWAHIPNGLQIGNGNDYLTARHHVVGGIFLPPTSLYKEPNARPDPIAKKRGNTLHGES